VEPSFDEAPQTAPGRGPWPLIAVVAAITLLAVLLIPSEEEPPPPLPQPTASRIEREQPGAEVPAQPEGALARGLITEMELRAAKPDEYFEQAVRLEADGLVTDAYLLYFRAARVEHVPSALRLGRLNDPNYQQPGRGMADPDLVQAHKWYLRAAKGGSLEAQRDLEALRSLVEARATEGDQRAQHLMLQWN